MKTMAIRLMLGLGLVVLPVLGAGCDGEPEGSCTTSEFSTDWDNYGSHDVCTPHETAASCAQVHGTFQEGDDCALAGLINAVTAN